MNKNKYFQPRAFFGRKSGKRMLKGQQILFEELLPKIEIKLDDNDEFDPQTIFAGKSKIILEIGYGGGEHLAKMAKENPSYGFVGCEVFTGGIGKMLQKIKEGELENIYLYNDDAIKLLLALKPGSIDEIYLLYPDPWPKKKHHKRRFVAKTTLDLMARALKPKGLFYFATDIEDYANWTLAHIVRQGSFSLIPHCDNQADLPFFHQPFGNWQSTRYEQKARKEQRNKSFYFTFELGI